MVNGKKDLRKHKPFTKDEFEYALGLTSKFRPYPDSWYEMDKVADGKKINEYCYIIPLILYDPIRILKVYSSVSRRTNISREVKGDAIRVVLADLKGEPVHDSFKRLNRNGNWEWNLRLRISQAIASLGFDTKCPKCRKDLFLRWNRKDGRRFLGCSMWKKDGTGCSGQRPFNDGA